MESLFKDMLCFSRKKEQFKELTPIENRGKIENDIFPSP